MSSLKILHLSDLHIGNFRYDDPNVLPVKICDTLYEQGKKVDVIVVSGDIFDGRSINIIEDRNFAIVFFETLIKQLKNKGISTDSITKENILFIPGNHDLVRKKNKEFEKYDGFIKAFY